MKKPKIDLSKQGMKSFLLHHVEKLILGLAIVLLGVFFWLGFGTEKFSKESPKGLSDLSVRAHSSMVKDTSWSEIEEFRQADHDAHLRIEQLDKVTIPVTEYAYKPILGTKAMTAGLRMDPVIIPAQHLMAQSFTTTVLARRNPNSDPDVVTLLPLASASDEDDDGGGGGIGIGGGAGAGLEGGNLPTRTKAKPKRSRDDGTIQPGDALLNFHRQELPGIRPEKFGLNPSTSRGLMCNVVAVTGLIDFEKQLSEFRSALGGAQGYFPKRDRPLYSFLQIERQAEGQDDWEDITEKVLVKQWQAYVADAPEVVAPDYFDKVLTSPIPTMTQFDYREYSTWPMYNMNLPDGFQADDSFVGIPLRDVLEYPDGGVLAPIGDAGEDIDDPFSGNSDLDDRKPDQNRGNRRGGQDRRPGAGDFAGPDLSGGGRDRGSRASGPAGVGRIGSDMEAYENAMKTMKDRGKYRLVRFFDVNTVRRGTKPTNYRYRVRVWLKDANNEHPDGYDSEADENAGRGRDRGGSIGAGGGGAGLVDEDQPTTQGGSGDDEEEDTSVYVAVTDLMKHPSVRNRINNDDLERPKDRDDLDYSVYSDWSEPTEWVTVGKPQNAEFYAGRIDPPKSTRINENYINEGEPVANIAAVKWDPEFGVRVPANREARRSDVLTFTADAHVLHPVDWEVRKIEQAEIDTDATLVDIIGGEEIRGLSSARSPVKYSLPGEILVMAADGSLHIQNEIEDQPEYFHLLFQEDETAEMGKRRKSNKDDDERPGNNQGDRGDRGRGGRGGGGDDPGF